MSRTSCSWPGVAACEARPRLSSRGALGFAYVRVFPSSRGEEIGGSALQGCGPWEAWGRGPPWWQSPTCTWVRQTDALRCGVYLGWSRPSRGRCVPRSRPPLRTTGPPPARSALRAVCPCPSHGRASSGLVAASALDMIHLFASFLVFPLCFRPSSPTVHHHRAGTSHARRRQAIGSERRSMLRLGVDHGFEHRQCAFLPLACTQYRCRHPSSRKPGAPQRKTFQ